jgi:cytochrome c-type biogenesis protein CcmH/NrfG
VAEPAAFGAAARTAAEAEPAALGGAGGTGVAEPAAVGAAARTAAEAEPARPGGRPRTAGEATPRWLRPPVQAGLAGLLLVAGLGAGYLVAVQAAPDRAPRVTGEAGAAMPGPVGERVREYRARLETDPRDVEALLGMADLNLQRRDIPRAVEYYKRVIEVDAGNPDALARLGMILGEAGQYPESVATLDRALDRDPNHLEALWWKGQVQLFGLEDYRAAATTWERLAALLPPGPDQDRARQALARAREGATPASPASGAAPKARGPAVTTPAPR